MTYSMASVPNPAYANQQLPLGQGYSSERVAFCYQAPYPMSTYLPPASMGNDVSSGEAKNNGNPPADESEKSARTDEENTDSADFPSAEQKAALLSSNDGSTHPQQINVEQQEDKRREPHSVSRPTFSVERTGICLALKNPRPRWKVGDMCFARWSEDGEVSCLPTSLGGRRCLSLVLLRDGLSNSTSVLHSHLL